MHNTQCGCISSLCVSTQHAIASLSLQGLSSELLVSADGTGAAGESGERWQ